MLSDIADNTVNTPKIDAVIEVVKTPLKNSPLYTTKKKIEQNTCIDRWNNGLQTSSPSRDAIKKVTFDANKKYPRI
jgi:hypothetical protein